MFSSKQLQDYFARIGLSSLWQEYLKDPIIFCSKDNLKKLVLAHTLSIPFENIDVHNKLRGVNVPIPIDLPTVFKKIVSDAQGRGGYCFETTGLLSAVLTDLGFQACSGIASVHWLKDKPAIRTHQYLIVTLGNQELLVDPGFGQPGPIEPIILKEDGKYFTALQQFPAREADAFLVQEDPDVKGGFKLFSRIKHVWQPDLALKPIYASDPTDVCDEEVLLEQNRVVSASDRSPFLTRLIVTQPFEEGDGQYGRYSLSQTELKRYSPRDGSEVVETISSQAHWMQVLKGYFNMELPKGSDLTAKQVTFTPIIDKLSALLSTPPSVQEIVASSSITFTPAALTPQAAPNPAPAPPSPSITATHLSPLRK